MADTPLAAPDAPAALPESAPATISASLAAANKGDFSAFDKAHLAARRGAPLPDVPQAPDAAQTIDPTTPGETAAPPERTLSRRQEQLNAAAQKAVERATADLRAENDRLKRELTGRTTGAPVPESRPPQPAQTPPTPPATYEAAIARPNPTQPLLTEEAFFQQFPTAPYSAYTRYATAYDRASADHQSRQVAEQREVETAQRQMVDGFVSQIQAAKAADPTFVTSLSDRVKLQLKPFAALSRDPQSGHLTEPAGPINVIGEQVYASDVAPAMLTHFSAHPEDLDRLTTVPASLATLPQGLRDQRHIEWMIREYGRLEARVTGTPAPADASTAPHLTAQALPAATAVSAMTSLPPPGPDLKRGGVPAPSSEAALKRGDFAEFDRLDLQKRAQKKRGVAA